MHEFRRAQRPAILAAFAASAALAAGAAQAGPVGDGKPFYLECDVASVTEAKVTGVGARTFNYNYKLKYLVDPASKTVTSLLDFHARRGNYEKTVFIDDVRQMNDLQLVFCADDQFGCKPFDRTINAGRQFGKIGLFVVNMRDLTIGHTYESHAEGGGQLGSERNQVNGTCRVVPA